MFKLSCPIMWTVLGSRLEKIISILKQIYQWFRIFKILTVIITFNNQLIKEL